MQPLTLTSAWPWGSMKIDEWPAVVMPVLQPIAAPTRHARPGLSDISFALSMPCNASGGEKDQPKTSAPPNAPAEPQQALNSAGFSLVPRRRGNRPKNFDGFNPTFTEWPECSVGTGLGLQACLRYLVHTPLSEHFLSESINRKFPYLWLVSSTTAQRRRPLETTPRRETLA